MRKADLIELLAEVYDRSGPTEVVDSKMRRVPPRVYAAMTKEQIDNKWDFPAMHLMHRIAKALSAASK